MKNKNFLLSLFIIACFANAIAQAPNWAWAKSAGGSSNDAAQSVAVDANGNVYVAGFFSSANISFNSDTLINAGSFDIFLTKFDALGNALWAKGVGGTGFDEALSVNVDPFGNIYMTGYYNSTIYFDTITLINAGDFDVFVAKYDTSGNVLWAKSAGGSSFDFGRSITTDANGNVYLTGDFQSSQIIFDNDTLTNIAGGSYGKIFTVKYNNSGNVLWAKTSDGGVANGGNGISVDDNGNVYVTGEFGALTITFGNITLTNADNTAVSTDFFITKYDSSGTVIWAKRAGGTKTDLGNAISTDANNNVYVTGYFNSGAITFGSTALTNATLGKSDVFIAKYDSSGNALWAKSAGGSKDDISRGISVDANENVSIIGNFNSSSIIFGSTTLMNTSLDTANIFIAKYDLSGNALWAKSTGGADRDFGAGISTEINGEIYCTGSFQSSSIIFGNDTLTQVGGGDIFIVKLDNVTGIIEGRNIFNAINISPNPTPGKFSVTSNQQPATSIEIYNILGEKVFQTSTPKFSSSNEIDLSKYPSGIYFVKLVLSGAEGNLAEEKIYTGKIVKE